MVQHTWAFVHLNMRYTRRFDMGKPEMCPVNLHADGPDGTKLSLVFGSYSWKIKPKQ